MTTPKEIHDKEQLFIRLLEETQNLNDIEKLFHIAESGKKIIFTTSFGNQDQCLTDLICKNKVPNIDFATLDTGRLFNETYSLIEKTRELYGITIKTAYPDAKKLEDFITQNGPNAFYNSIEMRKQCCFLRKVEPLARVIKGYDIWISGLKKDDSGNRADINYLEFSHQHNIIKFYPILNFTNEKVDEYNKNHSVPYNSLYDRGFKSIGCAPCTRAIKEGDDPRAGRWWWESREKSKLECGLHS